MADETRTLILTQPEGDTLALEHTGTVLVHGDRERDPLRHDVGAQVVHGTAPQRPLVHMVCWGEDDRCRVEVGGRLTVAGDEAAPLRVTMAHRFENEHVQAHRLDPVSFEPMDCTVHVPTGLVNPIHHALQLRTPLQVRFCNPWHVASDYTVEVSLGDRRLWSIRLTGATVATPQPCRDDDCPPVTGGRPA